MSSCSVGLQRGAVIGSRQVAHSEKDLMSAGEPQQHLGTPQRNLTIYVVSPIAVAQQPVTVGVHGAMGDANAFQFYKGGVLTAECGSKVDHGVTVVGYGTDAASGKDYCAAV